MQADLAMPAFVQLSEVTDLVVSLPRALPFGCIQDLVGEKA